ncbi:MAG: hypothetical protein P9M14_17230 [Candidatus Alcyoniella australis]|nr:hypothetical protein [Candidatus Alcyoniella australis]
MSIEKIKKCEIIKLEIDRRLYAIQLCRKSHAVAEAPRLVVVGYQPNELSRKILKICIESIQRFTIVPYELWVVDNNSPFQNAQWLLDWPNINVVLNRTEPRSQLKLHRRLMPWRELSSKQHSGSYANAAALEIAAKLIDNESRYIMTLHMDTMPATFGWLGFLQGKINDTVRAAGVRMDTARVEQGVLHVLGCLVDFQLLTQLKVGFFPDLPRLDVGDRVTVALREAGYQVYACRNTLWQPELASNIPGDSPFRSLNVDRSFDDDDNIIFLHLGRGIVKSEGKKLNGMNPQQWIEFAEDYLAKSPGKPK